MPSVELIALVFVSVMLVAAWAYLLAHRRSLPRMWALIARKPHMTRRAHVIRQLVFKLEMIWVWVPGLTAMAVAMLLGCYVVYVLRWADVIGVVFFLATGALVIVAYGVRHEQLARRMGLLCPRCGVMWVEERGFSLVKTGHCPECSALVFPIHGRG